MFNFIKNISPAELIIIALVLTLFLGRKAVIGLSKTSGESLKEIKKIKKSFNEAIEDDEPHKNEEGVQEE